MIFSEREDAEQGRHERLSAAPVRRPGGPYGRSAQSGAGSHSALHDPLGLRNAGQKRRQIEARLENSGPGPTR